MRDLNTVGLNSAAESERDKMMGSPRPGYGRVNRIYEPQELYGYGRLGSPTGGRKKYRNPYTNPNPNPNANSVQPALMLIRQC